MSVTGALAVEVLEDALSGAPADRALKRALRAHPALHNDERRALARWVFRVVLFQRRLAFSLGGDHGALDGLDARGRARRLLAAHLALEEGRSIESALYEVGLDDEHRAALERARERPPPLPDDPVERLAIERSLPSFLARLFVTERGLEEADRLLAAMNEPGPITLRASSRMGDRDDLADRLEQEGIRTAKTALSPWGLVVNDEGGRKPNLWGSRAFREGRFEVQDEGSQLIALACEAAPGETVLDLCAGRGGKTLALATMMRGEGRLVATDIDERSLADLAPRTARAGETWISARALEDDGDAALSGLVGACDCVLVDAPCSSLGTLRRGPHARWLVDEGDLVRYPELQRRILARAVPLLRPGGRLVYATCTLARDENERVAEWLAKRFGELRPRPLPLDVAEGRAALTLLPHVHGTDGFFLAAFTRQ